MLKCRVSSTGVVSDSAIFWEIFYIFWSKMKGRLSIPMSECWVSDKGTCGKMKSLSNIGHQVHLIISVLWPAGFTPGHDCSLLLHCTNLELLILTWDASVPWNLQAQYRLWHIPWMSPFMHISLHWIYLSASPVHLYAWWLLHLPVETLTNLLGQHEMGKVKYANIGDI